MEQAVQSALSEQEYLDGEAASPIRHEYEAGEVFAMAGGSKAHNTISLNVATLLPSKLRGRGCQTFIADMRVHIASQSSYYYPDVVVTSAPEDLSSDAPKDRVEAPRLIVEVLSGIVAASAALQLRPTPCGWSPTTEAIDRDEKMLAYRHIKSLREYDHTQSSRIQPSHAGKRPGQLRHG
ncbi:MAG: Uma2 family endonuclease [Thiobacillus sp.]